MTKRRFCTKGDLLLTAGLLLAAGLLFLPRACARPDRIVAEISDAGVVRQIDLTALHAPQEILAADGRVMLRAEPGRICFAHSDCPDGTCVAFGWLERAGDYAACVPEKVYIRLIGQAERDGVDAVI